MFNKNINLLLYSHILQKVFGNKDFPYSTLCKKHENSSWSGGKLDEYLEITIDECALKCFEDDNCQSLSVRHSDGWCGKDFTLSDP